MEPAGPSLAGIERVLRGFGGNPDTVGGVLGLVPLGVTNMFWRNNEVVEAWHVERRLSDGDVLRVNSFTTYEIGSQLRKWREQLRLVADAASTAIESVTMSQFEEFALGLAAWMTQATRFFPMGQRLGDVAGESISAFSDHVADHACDWVDAAEDHGVRWALTWAAGHGAAACRKWWGAPIWPERVSIMIDAIGEPTSSLGIQRRTVAAMGTAATDPRSGLTARSVAELALGDRLSHRELANCGRAWLGRRRGGRLRETPRPIANHCQRKWIRSGELGRRSTPAATRRSRSCQTDGQA